MFEYLMPLLVMPTYDRTLLDETYPPWWKGRSSTAGSAACHGVSESGYYEFDAHLNYQYRAFGVPGLGFKARLGRRRGPLRPMPALWG